MFVLICSLAQVRTGLPKLFPSEAENYRGGLHSEATCPEIGKGCAFCRKERETGHSLINREVPSESKEIETVSSQKKCKWQTGNEFSFYSFGLSRPLQTLGWKFSTSWPLGMAKESLGASPMKWSQTLESRRQL